MELLPSARSSSQNTKFIDTTILAKIYETNFGVSVKKRTTGKVQFQFFNRYFASIEKIFIFAGTLDTRL